MPVVDFGNKANAGPASLMDLGEVFHALEIRRNVFSFFFGCLVTDWIGFVDIIDAEYFNIMWAKLIGSICFKRRSESRCSEPESRDCNKFHEHCVK